MAIEEGFEKNYDLCASYENKLTCPYCGWKDEDSWERGNEGSTFCERCEEEFAWTTEVERTFFSYKKIKTESGNED